MFVNFLLTDEINRAPAKVQSALLEVMAEHQVTIGGITHPVPDPFFVVATQNPIESEGVYQLPDAQRDRFMMKIVLDHPTAHEEMVILDRMAVNPPVAEQVIDLDGLDDAPAHGGRRVRRPHASRSTRSTSCRRTRHPTCSASATCEPSIGLGASPRATLNLVRGARALALLRGRTYATPQDVFDVAPEVLRHRLLLTYDALARDITHRHVINRILATVPATWVSPKPNDASGLTDGRPSTLPEPTGRRVDARRAARPGTAERLADGPPTNGGRAAAHARADDQPAPRRRRCTATTRASRPGTAASRASPASTSPATTSAASTGTSPPARTRPTSATRSPTATSRRGSWSTSSATMRFGTDANDKAQTALAAAACVGFLTARNQNRLGCRARRRTVRPGDATRAPAATRSARSSPTLASPPPSEGLGRSRPRRRDRPSRRDRKRRGFVAVVVRLQRRRVDRAARPGSACATTSWRSRCTTPASSTSRRSVWSTSSIRRPGDSREVRVTAAVQRTLRRGRRRGGRAATRRRSRRAGADLIELSTDGDWLGDDRQPRAPPAYPGRPRRRSMRA